MGHGWDVDPIAKGKADVNDAALAFRLALLPNAFIMQASGPVTKWTMDGVMTPLLGYCLASVIVMTMAFRAALSSAIVTME